MPRLVDHRLFGVRQVRSLASKLSEIDAAFPADGVVVGRASARLATVLLHIRSITQVCARARARVCVCVSGWKHAVTLGGD